MNQVQSTPWRDPGEATGQRLGLLELAASWEPRACSQDLRVGRPPASSSPSCTGPQEGAGGALRAGGGHGGVPGIKRLPSTPAGPRPSQFSGKKGSSLVPHKVSTFEKSPYSFGGAISASPPPQPNKHSLWGPFPLAFLSSVWVTPLPGLPAGQETGGTRPGARGELGPRRPASCSPQPRAMN